MKSTLINDQEITRKDSTRLHKDDVLPGMQHSIAWRLNSSLNPDSVAQQLKHHIDGLPALQKQNSQQHYLWIEPQSSSAEREYPCARVRKEMERPLTRDYPGIRIVLLTWADRVTDLIIVSHLAVFNKPLLEAVVRAALTEQPPVYPSAAAPSYVEADEDTLLAADFSPLPDWRGKGVQEGIDLHLGTFSEDDEKTRVAQWISALTTVWARFSATQTPVIAVNDSVSKEWGLVAAQVKKDTTARRLVTEITRTLSAPVPYTKALTTRLRECENGGEVTLAALVYDAAIAPCAGVSNSRYLPVLKSPWPLTLLIEKQEQGNIAVRGLADGNLFARERAETFFQCVLRTYEQQSANGDLKLWDFPLLNEQQQLELVAAGATPQPVNVPHERLETLFKQQATSTPEAVALSYEGEEMTYQQLDLKAHIMTLNLVLLNVRPGDRVGLCLERSFDLIASMLAILKAGAIYIPMDPAWPEERLSYTCDNAEIHLVITDRKTFPASEGLRLIAPAELEKPIYDARVSVPTESELSTSDAAYVIYTSGSTGKPKGVVIPHQNVVSLLAATRADFGLNGNDSWTFFHSAAFDFSVWEIWGSLLTGARLVIVPYWVSRAPDEFIQLVREQKVSVLNQTPSAFTQFMEMERRGAPLPHLRLIIFGGEPLDAKMLVKWFDRYPEHHCRLVNMFGITETTVHVTAQTVTRAEAIAGSLSVGRALPGWGIYVLDAARQLLPAGVAGEIYVAGAGVASMYLNRPELTEERFIPDPFSGGRMYRSGDKGRLQSSGCLEHAGRLDNQIKLRGFRIELDEIRKVLLEVNGVEAAAVVLNQPDKNDPASARLDSYLVLSDSSVEAVVTKAKNMLPTYMMPSTFTQVDVMPLTANGKLDVKKLPEPGAHSQVMSESKAIPEQVPRAEVQIAETRLDRLIADMTRIWSEVLGQQVVAADNFFNLGGNSLYAVRIASAMRAEKLPILPMRELYVQQTIEKLAPLMLDNGGH